MPSSPNFAVVSAVYGTEKYLDDYFASLDSQTYPHDRIRVVLVDDGSLDASGEMCERWASQTDIDVTVLHQENAGQAAARNAGLAVLGDDDWVTFIDPDDFVDTDYFEALARFADANQTAVLLSANQVDYFESDPSRGNRHPLRFRFAGGDQLVNIERFPRFFQLNSAAACFKLGTLRDHGLEYDPRIRPNFEDGHLIARYLLTEKHPLVGFVASAIYHYRRREDGSSTLQLARADPRRYTDVLEFGYLDILQRAKSTKGRVPTWLQNEIIYDLAWIFRSEDAMFGGTASLDSAIAERFHQLVKKCRAFLDTSTIEGFSVIQRSTAQREALAHGYSQTPWRWDSIVLDGNDSHSGLVQLVYHYTGAEAPSEEVFIRGRRITPRHTKTRDFTYLRRALVHERILWVPSDGELTVRLDGEPVPLTGRWPQAPVMAMRTSEINKVRKSRHRGAAISAKPNRARRRFWRQRKRKTRDPYTVRRARAERLARSSRVQKLFRNAWVLMDRSHTAHDNGEHLFRYLRANRRDINAWFVVKKGTADWDRLRAAGYKRIIPHGSLIWMALCLNATHIISSHADRYVYNPFPKSNKWAWRFVFLQHGITKDDISRWLNSKTIDGLVTASAQEYASIVGDGSGYKFTTREAHLTGFPRHDRLTQLVTRVDAGNGKRCIVIMPTWRQYLAGETVGGTGERTHNRAFADSYFASSWRDLLQSPELHAAAASTGAEILFMPHPNLEQYIPEFEVPDGVSTGTYGDNDVQEVIASAALVITDYSSNAFDAAFARRPVLYYQFDRDQVFGGGHITRPGYFDYRRDGFGPVAETHDEAVSSAVEILTNGLAPAPEYTERIERTFTLPRTGACKRTVAMIESISPELTARERRTPVPTPKAPPIAWGS